MGLGGQHPFCGVRPDNAPWDFEVVYLDGERAMTKPVVWGREAGFFPTLVRHADNYPAFSTYVEKLRSG